MLVADECGMGMNSFGYYSCAVTMGIYWVFGFDKELKDIPTQSKEFMDVLETFYRRFSCSRDITSCPWSGQSNRGYGMKSMHGIRRKCHR